MRAGGRHQPRLIPAGQAAHGIAIAVTAEQSADPVSARMPAADRRSRRPGWLAAKRVPDEWRVVVLALIVSICAYTWYVSRGLTFGYADALSRMVIARRVVASTTPGLAQLGTTWPPLHMIAMLPLIWNNTLFHDGFAGAFPSMVSYVLASLYIFRMARRLDVSRGGAWTAALVFICNPSITYMQSTAMSALPMICTATIAIYYMLCWARSYHALDLMKSSAAVAAGTGIRYDGWALAGVLAVLVVYLAWRRQGLRGAQAWGILYGILAFSGCAAWVIYNAVIFHDPLLFLFFGNAHHNTAYMAKFPSYHHAWLSFEMDGYSAAGMVGWVTTAFAILGLAVFIWRHRMRQTALPAYALLVPLAFLWLTFYVGFDTILMPQLGFSVYWNVRFGLMLTPAAAFFAGYLASVRRAMLAVVLAGLAMFVAVNSTISIPLAMREPLAASTHGATAQAEAEWFLHHYRGGKLLISYVPSAPAIFYMLQRIPDHNLVTDSNGARFTHALASPQSSVTWVIMQENDPDNPIWTGLHRRQGWRRHFVLRKVMGGTAFYERIPCCGVAGTAAPAATVPDAPLTAAKPATARPG